jgi:hypothetical protein
MEHLQILLSMLFTEKKEIDSAGNEFLLRVYVQILSKTPLSQGRLRNVQF